MRGPRLARHRDLDRIKTLHPDRFTDNHARTVQRAVKRWCAEQARQIIAESAFTIGGAETTNRINGDQQLEDLATDNQPLVFASQMKRHNLSNDFGLVIASVTLPRGDYLFHGVVDVMGILISKEAGAAWNKSLLGR